ncbi:MAG: DNA-binding protein YbiB, partial [Paraburkholderia nemoris]
EVDLPEARDASTTAAWIDAVLRGEAPVPSAIERQVELIVDVAKIPV